MNLYQQQLPLFLALAFGISWGIFGIVYASFGGDIPSTAMMFTGILFMFGPMLAGFFVSWKTTGAINNKALLINFKPNPWFLAAWLLMPIYAVATFVLSLTLPGVSYDPEMLGMIERFAESLSPEQIAELKAQTSKLPVPVMVIMIFQALLAGASINALFAFGEELGWRTYMLQALSHQSFWKGSFMIGAIWGLWHAPLILMGHNYPQHPVIGVGMMTLWCILLSPLFTYITLRARSVIAAAVLHGMLNASAGLAILYARGSDLLAGTTGLAGMLCLVLFLVLLYFLDKSKILGKPLCNKTIGEGLLEKS